MAIYPVQYSIHHIPNTQITRRKPDGTKDHKTTIYYQKQESKSLKPHYYQKQQSKSLTPYLSLVLVTYHKTKKDFDGLALFIDTKYKMPNKQQLTVRRNEGFRNTKYNNGKLERAKDHFT